MHSVAVQGSIDMMVYLECWFYMLKLLVLDCIAVKIVTPDVQLQCNVVRSLFLEVKI